MAIYRLGITNAELKRFCGYSSHKEVIKSAFPLKDYLIDEVSNIEGVANAWVEGERVKKYYRVRKKVLNQTLYRVEELGRDYRNILSAAEVLSFEYMELENTDIEKYLLTNGMINGLKWREYLDKMVGSDAAYIPPEMQKNPIKWFSALLTEVKRVTGYEVNYALWLGEKQDVVNLYCSPPIENNYQLMEYPISILKLSDLGRDGCLYGYTVAPKPVSIKSL